MEHSLIWALQTLDLKAATRESPGEHVELKLPGVFFIRWVFQISFFIVTPWHSSEQTRSQEKIDVNLERQMFAIHQVISPRNTPKSPNLVVDLQPRLGTDYCTSSDSKLGSGDEGETQRRTGKGGHIHIRKDSTISTNYPNIKQLRIRILSRFPDFCLYVFFFQKKVYFFFKLKYISKGN